MDFFLLLWRYNSDKCVGLLDNILPFKAVLYLFCPLHKLHLLQIIPDIIFPLRLGPSSWSSCEWFPFVEQCKQCGHYIHLQSFIKQYKNNEQFDKWAGFIIKFTWTTLEYKWLFSVNWCSGSLESSWKLIGYLE